MSAVKIFALGVLLTGTLATRSLAGSMNGTQDSPTEPDGRSIAAANLAGNWTGFSLSSPSPALSYQGGGRVAGQPGGLVLGTTESTTTASPISFGNASFRLANSVPDAIPSQPAPVEWEPYSAPVQPLPSPAPAVSWTAASELSPVAGNPPASPGQSDAFINFGTGPFADASTLTTGNPQSFLNSPVFSQMYGPGGPSSQDIANFEAQVVSTVEKTYNNAGLPIRLTTDPNAPAAHTLSVVSNASNPDNPGAIGITAVGGNGYTFLDKFGYASNAAQLATAVGHNVAHELMHAFGLANHPETSGPYVDAATSTFSSLADPNTGFSSAAASLLSTLNFQATDQSISSGTQVIEGDQILIPEAAPVPEPSTIAIWTLAGVAVIARRRRKLA